MVVEPVHGLLETRRTVLRKRKLWPPMAREAVVVVALVISRRGNDRNHAVEPAAGAKPLAPLGVAVVVVHQIAGVEHERGPGARADWLRG